MSISLPAPIRILISSSELVRHWWAQRLTAVALIPLSLWFIYSLTTMLTANYDTVVLWLSNLKNSLLMLFFILILYYHALLGLQVVIEDYVESVRHRKALLLFVKTIISLTLLCNLLVILFIYMKF